MSTQYRFDGNVRNGPGFAIAGCQVYVCTQPASTGSIPPSPLATIYSDNAGANPITQPLLTDGNGNFEFYTATGIYTVVIFDPFNRIQGPGGPGTPIVYPDQEVVTQGGGSVTSVAMTMDGVIFNSVVSGSPISSSGTLAPALLTQSANRVLAGPSSGSAATPTFRALVANDIPALAYVSSIGISLTLSALLSGSVSGSPVTSSGTIGLTINFANQNANLVLAGPASGAAGAVTARALAGADIFLLTVVTDAASVNFDCSTAAWPTFDLTLSQNTTIAIINAVAGQHFTCIFRQNATGGFKLTFPATMYGWSNVETNAHAVSVQTFVCVSSTEFRAIGPGETNAT